MSGDTAASPWLLIGVEGVTGTLLCTFVLYPLAWLCPGPDYGSYENPLNTAHMLLHSPMILGLTAVFCVLVFILNSFSVLVTYMLSSVWHAILDNFRPVCIWAVQLTLYYAVSDGKFGEAWTETSHLQLSGMIVLLLGTAVYNGSIQVPGLGSSDLIGHSSAMSSGALARSPLVTKNASPLFSKSPLGYHTSPYAARQGLAVGDGLGAGLLEKA
jgi:hypothetical protein